MDYDHIHVHMQITRLHPTFETMDLSDISKFEDLMTTSSDEDIPVLEDSVP